MKNQGVACTIGLLVCCGTLMTGCGPKPVAYSTPVAAGAPPPMPPPGQPGGQVVPAGQPAMPGQPGAPPQ